MSVVREKYKQYIYMGIVLIALGATYSTTMKGLVGSIGTVFVAIGGLFFIIGMRKKQQRD